MVLSGMKRSIVKLDEATTCLDGSVSEASLPVGHYRLQVSRDQGAGISGEFDGTE